MSKWTQEHSQKQRALINSVKPWLKSTGPRTREGKEKNRMNALKNGDFTSEKRAQRSASLEEFRSCLKAIDKLYA